MLYGTECMFGRLVASARRPHRIAPRREYYVSTAEFFYDGDEWDACEVPG